MPRARSGRRRLHCDSACPSPALYAAPVQFTNITKSAGINFVHFKGANGTSTILEEAGPGVCVADFDGDGYQDIYFVNGRDLYKRGIADPQRALPQ